MPTCVGIFPVGLNGHTESKQILAVAKQTLQDMQNEQGNQWQQRCSTACLITTVLFDCVTCIVSAVLLLLLPLACHFQKAEVQGRSYVD